MLLTPQNTESVVSKNVSGFAKLSTLLVAYLSLRRDTRRVRPSFHSLSKQKACLFFVLRYALVCSAYE